MLRTIPIVALAMLVLPTIVIAEDVYIGRRVTGTVALDKIDHSSWNDLLKKYVDENGMVNYKAWHSSRQDIQKLNQYLAILSTGIANQTSQGGKLAFWINAYNAGTIRGILREYPTTSIRNHTARLFGYNIWKNLKLYVGGRAYSLEAMEHEVLRKMGEPRIHFAIVCASIGCPRLLNEAYTPAKVNDQLERNARDFFRRSQNFRYDKSGQRFYLSEIFSWFPTDFGDDQAAQLRRISTWLPTKESQQAAKANTVRISYLTYNWNLNSRDAPAGDGVDGR